MVTETVDGRTVTDLETTALAALNSPKGISKGVLLQAVAAVRELARRAARYREALEQIAQWDCLNPPDPNLCHDHPWLKRLVDDALANGDWWEQVEAARTRERRAATPDTPPDAPTEEGT
jgi:hypothetical protein